VKNASFLGDLRDSVSEASDVRSGEAGKSKELGMGYERGVEKTRGRRDEVLVALGGSSAEGLAGFLVNFLVVGSL
jgi:hypothetical protein